jgi:hypothetical protein
MLYQLSYGINKRSFETRVQRYLSNWIRKILYSHFLNGLRISYSPKAAELTILIATFVVPMEARLKQGFGPADFGCSQSECLKQFGTPDEKETLEGITGADSEVWHYWEKGFSLFFDPAFESKFCSVEIDQSFPLTLFGKTIFGTKEQELTTLLKEKGYLVSDSEQHEWGERRVTFDDIFADFYFEKGVLVSVNYSVPLGELIN